jgi:hypothetical protein
VAEGVLDSLATAPGAGSGAGEVDGLRVSWRVEAGTIRVEVAGPDGQPLATLEGDRWPAVPVLPDAGTAPEGGEAAGAWPWGGEAAP